MNKYTRIALVASLLVSGSDMVDNFGGQWLYTRQVDEVQIEATFPDGTKLVTVHEPIR